MTSKLIKYLFAVLVLIVNSPLNANAEAISKMTIKELIVKHSVEMGMDPALALSIAKSESGFCQEKRSSGGAVGVFQLMPNTAKRMGYNPYHVHDNIKGGIAYYKKMYSMFGKMELALAAYNAGPGNVKKYRGVPPFAETRKFVDFTMTNYKHLKTNPDPAIIGYNSNLKNISNIEKAENHILEHESILNSYMENLGI